MPTYTSQCSSKAVAEQRVAAIRAEGRWASEPVEVLAPNGRDMVWAYSASFDKIEEKK